ncbi:MAG: heat-inducible transcriptional repressor HrcA [Acidobacteria bacterium]|nr:heat-inducible transcriptional repressor HrcA [Acidobacteriota bacterium]
MRVEPLDSRRQQILEAVVRTHISTGEPVGSATVARQTGRKVSSATIRNEMAALEEAGYLRQPHTSAGRVPTAKAYEVYAQEVASRARLRPADQVWINRRLPVEQGDTSELVARAPHVLAELLHGIGLVLLPALTRTELEQVRFLALDDQRVLAVLMTRSGLVRDKAIRARERLHPDELNRMSDYINRNFRGWTLEAARREIERRAAAERSEFLRRALALCQESFEAEGGAALLHLEGVAHLLEPVGASPEELRQLLQAVEEKERLARFLADCAESPEHPLRIWIGLERLAPAMTDFALVSARYGAGQPGLLGLLSRTRMDYARAISAVGYVATLFDRALAEN